MSDSEYEVLTALAEQKEMSMNDILREYIRSLKQQQPAEKVWANWEVQDKDSYFERHVVVYKEQTCAVYEEKTSYEVWIEGILRRKLPLDIGITQALLDAQALLKKLADEQ